MKSILIGGALLFLIGWVIGFFVLGAGMLIHTLAAVSLIFWIQGVIVTPRRKTQDQRS